MIILSESQMDSMDGEVFYGHEYQRLYLIDGEYKKQYVYDKKSTEVRYCYILKNGDGIYCLFNSTEPLINMGGMGMYLITRPKK